MKILVVCYCYPPDIGPRAFRWSAVAARWAGEGHEVHVVSGRKPGAAREERLDGVHVHRVGGAFIDNLRTWIERRRRDGGDGGKRRLAGEELGGQELSSALGLLKRIHDATWKKVYWPESTCLWFFPAWRETRRLLKTIPFDAMISTSTPYTGHLVGHAAKRRFPGLHWMVDIGDPFAFNAPPWNNARLYNGLNHRSEGAVLRDADSVSMTVQSCLDEYVRTFPPLDLARKTAVIPPLMNGRPAHPRPAGTRPDGLRRLVFTGSLYRDVRKPDYLLRLVEEITARRPATEIHFFGRLNDCMASFEPYRRRLGKEIILHGPVDREEAVTAIQDADVLVNIGNATPYQLPSKIVDYLAAGRPILNLVTETRDSSLAVLSAYPAHLTLRETAGGPSAEDVERATAFIDSPPEVDGQVLAKFAGQFSIETIAKAYLDRIAVPVDSEARGT